MDDKKVHFGKGTLVHNGVQVGVVSQIAFIIEDVGFTHESNPKSCYGTLNGSIEDKELIQHLNYHKQTNTEILVELGEASDLKDVVISSVEFIDEIPHTGELEDTEFHGNLKS